MSVFAESGVERRSQTLYLNAREAGLLLKNYDDTGITVGENKIFRPGRVFEDPCGGLMLCLELVRRENWCRVLLAGPSRAGVFAEDLTELCNSLARGQIKHILPAPPRDAQLPENGRLHMAGDAVFTPFCSGSSEPVTLYPENGCFADPVSAPRAAMRLMMYRNLIAPLEGELFAVERPGMLPTVLRLYKSFDNLESGELIQICKISRGGRTLETSPYIGYDTLMTGICTRQIVPHIDIHF